MSLLMEFFGIFVPGTSGTKNSLEFHTPEAPGRKILWNSMLRKRRDEKFSGIPYPGSAGTKNSLEFHTPEASGRKILWNSMLRKRRDGKFSGISATGLQYDCDTFENLKIIKYNFKVLKQ
jgi:hypothetical protein